MKFNLNDKYTAKCTSKNTFNICLIYHEEVYPPRSGAHLRIYEFAKNLGRKGHKVFLISPSDRTRLGGSYSIRANQNLTIIRIPTPWILKRLTNSFRSIEWQKGFALFLINIFPFYLPILLRTIIAENIDIIQAEGLRMSLPSLLLGKILNKAVVFDDHNAETLLATRIYYFLKKKGRQKTNLLFLSLWAKYIKVIEKASCVFADVVIVPSNADADFLVKFLKVPSRKICAIPNGVTIYNRNKLKKILPKLKKRLKIGKIERLVAFVGNMYYPPNLYAMKWIVNSLAPKLATMQPTIKIMIVGSFPSQDVGSVPCNVFFTGEVPDVIPYVQIADVCIAPLSVGAGIKVKILYYLACGKPVITTSVGAEGLEDCSCLIKSKLSEFADKIMLVLNDAELQKKLDKEGKRYSLNFDWRTLTAKVMTLYDFLCA